MRERFLHAVAIIRVLSKETFVWCAGVIAGTLLLCMSFFTDRPVGREMTISSKSIQATENATAPDSNQTIIVNSVTNDILQLETKEASDSKDDSSDDFVGDFGIADYVIDVRVQFGDTDFAVDDLDSDNDVLQQDEYAVDGADYKLDVSNNYVVSLDEYKSLCKIVEAEASTQDIRGKTLVADVVLNRVDSNKYPDTIKEVILDKGQFDPVTRGAFYGAEPDSITKEAVMRALNGDNSSMGAIYFQKSNATGWGDKEYLFRHGDHSFYR